ncbi:MAG: serine/threonine-protein kinase [Myxococcota bacterium]
MSHPDVGRVLAGKYELQALAGAGGMAEVFRGVTLGAEGFRRPVAIKRILPELGGNPEFVAMFVEEARVQAALSHPNIVQIHDFDRDEDGGFFLVAELVDGLTLQGWRTGFELLDEETPWHLVAAIGIEVLKGLSAAHENVDGAGKKVPVYHRDVTPQNVLLGQRGHIKLTDFGLARAMDRARMTRPDIVKGKLSYLAPELTEGADPSVRSDLFSVGIVLWEALTQRKLFDAVDPHSVLMAVREAEVPPLEELRPDMPRALRECVHRALAKDPAERFRSARSMVRTLANLLRMTPESTSAEVLGRSVRRIRRRHEEIARTPRSRSELP